MQQQIKTAITRIYIAMKSEYPTYILHTVFLPPEREFLQNGVS
jgi:hypothetical protein